MSRKQYHPQTAYRRHALPTAALLSGIVSFAAVPARAATGLAGLEIFVWLFAGFALVMLAGLALAIFLLVKRARQAEPGGRRRKLVLRGLTILCLLLGAPVYLTIIQARSVEAGWWLVAVAYLVALACALFAMIESRKVVVIILGATLLISFFYRPGVISFTYYSIVENQPFEPTHGLAERRGNRFMLTDDGSLYRLVGYRELPREELFSPGAAMQVERMRGNWSEPRYRVQTVGLTSDYYHHTRDREDTWLVVPLNHVTIKKFSPFYVGEAELLSGRDWRATDRDLASELYMSCCDPDWIAELIERGADPTADRYGSRNLLHYLANEIARHDGMAVTARILADAGIDVNARDQWGKTPLYVAIDSAGSRYRENPDIEARVVAFVTALLDAGADPDIATEHGWTPLLEAVIWRRYGLARILLEYGADPTIANSSGRNPVTVASRRLEDNPPPVLEALVREMSNARR